MSKFKEIVSIISATSLLSTGTMGGFFAIAYKVHGQELVRRDAKAIQKPLEDEVKKLKKKIDTIQSYNRRTSEKLDFITDVLYEQNKRAFNKVKRARKDKKID